MVDEVLVKLEEITPLNSTVLLKMSKPVPVMVTVLPPPGRNSELGLTPVIVQTAAGTIGAPNVSTGAIFVTKPSSAPAVPLWFIDLAAVEPSISEPVTSGKMADGV
jgi:hypothetical protein